MVSRPNERNYFCNSFDLTDKDTVRNLKSWFGRVERGTDEIIDTPFAENIGESHQDTLDNWLNILESVSRRWPSLWIWENDLSKKVGPMSVQKPLADRMEDIEHYYADILLPAEAIDSRALKAVESELSAIRGIAVKDQRQTVEDMKKSTNSGSPFFHKKKWVIDQTIPCTNELNGLSVVQHLASGDFLASAVLGWRGQEGGPEVSDIKQRVIWMFPFAANIQELQVYQPLIAAIQQYNIFSAWVSMEAVDRRITRLFDSKDSKDLVVCTDFTRFDQHFGPVMQSAAHDILEFLLKPDGGAEWLDKVFPIKYSIPLAYDWGKVRFGHHGMGSGSGGTNADETLVHRALQYEAAIRANQRLNPDSMCLGDDGIITYPGIRVEDVVDSYASHGQEMNESKQSASTQDCTFLRRWHDVRYRDHGVCVGVYSTCRALGRLMYMERWMSKKKDQWNEKAVALRQLSILENCKWHPMREEFVEFCMKRDKYRLGIDIPGFLDNVVSIAQEHVADMPDFMGYTKSLQTPGDPTGGIGSWWIVKYLRSLS